MDLFSTRELIFSNFNLAVDDVWQRVEETWIHSFLSYLRLLEGKCIVC